MSVVNDVHSRLNETLVDVVVPVDSLESIGTALDLARSTRRQVSIAGGRHAMGGQQFCSGGVVFDTRPLAGVLSIDEERGLIEVEAGIQWPALIDALALTPWGSARSRRGPTTSASAAPSLRTHGRGLTYGPFVSDIESLVVGADGVARRAHATRTRPLPASSAAATASSASSTRRRSARSSPQGRAHRPPRARERARRALRRADRRGLPLRRLPVRDRPRVPRLPPARDLLLLPAAPDDTALGADHKLSAED